jgi:hypothetical protein
MAPIVIVSGSICVIEWPLTVQSCHSLGIETAADARFLIGDYRPERVIRQILVNVWFGDQRC